MRCRLYLRLVSYLRKRKAAFRYALQGLRSSLEREDHMRIHVAAAALAIIAGMALDIAAWEWFAVSSCIALVMICELLNTAVENLADKITTDPDPAVKYVKDISAAAVLVACILAVVTGMIVFGARLVPLASEIFGVFRPQR